MELAQTCLLLRKAVTMEADFVEAPMTGPITDGLVNATLRPLTLLNETANTTEPYNKPTNVVLMVSVWTCFFLIGVVGNSLVCLVVFKVRKMRNPTNYLLVNLAIADLLMALCTPLTILDFAKHDNSFGVLGCKLQIYTLDVFYAASTFTLICVAIERYFAVCRPMRFKELRKHLKLMIFLIWLCSCLVYSPMLWACTLQSKEVSGKSQLSCDCKSKWPKWYHYTIYAMCVVFCLYLLPMAIMLRCYVPVIRTLWKPSNAAAASTTRIDQRKAVVKTMVIVVAIFCLLWTPYNILYVLKKFRVDFKSVYGIVWYGALILAFLSNCVNPIVYTLMNRNFRGAVRMVFIKQRRISKSKLLESDEEDLSTSHSKRAKVLRDIDVVRSVKMAKDRSLTETTVLDGSQGSLSVKEAESSM